MTRRLFSTYNIDPNETYKRATRLKPRVSISAHFNHLLEDCFIATYTRDTFNERDVDSIHEQRRENIYEIIVHDPFLYHRWNEHGSTERDKDVAERIETVWGRKKHEFKKRGWSSLLSSSHDRNGPQSAEEQSDDITNDTHPQHPPRTTGQQAKRQSRDKQPQQAERLISALSSKRSRPHEDARNVRFRSEERERDPASDATLREDTPDNDEITVLHDDQPMDLDFSPSELQREMVRSSTPLHIQAHSGRSNRHVHGQNLTDRPQNNESRGLASSQDLSQTQDAAASSTDLSMRGPSRADMDDSTYQTIFREPDSRVGRPVTRLTRLSSQSAQSESTARPDSQVPQALPRMSLDSTANDPGSLAPGVGHPASTGVAESAVEMRTQQAHDDEELQNRQRSPEQEGSIANRSLRRNTGEASQTQCHDQHNSNSAIPPISDDVQTDAVSWTWKESSADLLKLLWKQETQFERFLTDKWTEVKQEGSSAANLREVLNTPDIIAREMHELEVLCGCPSSIGSMTKVRRELLTHGRAIDDCCGRNLIHSQAMSGPLETTLSAKVHDAMWDQQNDYQSLAENKMTRQRLLELFPSAARNEAWRAASVGDADHVVVSLSTDEWRFYLWKLVEVQVDNLTRLLSDLIAQLVAGEQTGLQTPEDSS